MSVETIHALNATGLVQFGLFDVDGDLAPFHFNLEMLPSYPDLLKTLAEDAHRLIGNQTYDRLVASADAIPLGLAISLETGIPLVYSRGTELPPVHDLVGAYDVGHPAVLIMSTQHTPTYIQRFLEGARGVGLEIHTILLMIATESNLEVTGVPIVSLFTLTGIVQQLASNHILPQEHVETVNQWLSHRPT